MFMVSIFDCSYGAWFLTRCSWPRPRELTIDLTDLYFQEFEWDIIC